MLEVLDFFQKVLTVATDELRELFEVKGLLEAGKGA
jgi:hypothetical protein